MKLADSEVLGKLLTRNILFILPFSCLGILAGNFASASTTPLFRSTSELFISTPASAVDLGLLATGGTFSQERVKSYSQIIDAPATLQPVIDKLNLATTAEALATRITARAPADTVVIRIQVVDENPERAAAIANEVSLQFAKTAESIELSQADLSSPVKVSVVRPAVAEYAPISPKKNTNRLLGFTLFTFGAYLFFLIRYLSDLTVKNVSDIKELPLLAAIGFDPNADKQPLLTDLEPYEARTEAFRSLRTNLLNGLEGKTSSVIAITSGVAEEGKTTTSINLAISISSLGLNTLLVEGDLRRPRLARYVNLPGFKNTDDGLSLILRSINVAELKRTVEKVTVKYLDNLAFIPSGEISQNPAELLSSPNLRSLFDFARRQYDIIIIDSPPVLPVTDTAIIAQSTDGVVLIVHGGRTKIKSFESTTDLLKAVNANILGVVINKIPNSRNADDYGYKSGYSNYYKRRYGYGLKRRGYTPYGPYNPREIEKIDKNTAKTSSSPKPEPELQIQVSTPSTRKSLRGGWKKRLIEERISKPESLDPEVEEWLSKWREKTATAKKSTAKKSTAKKSTRRKI